MNPVVKIIIALAVAAAASALVYFVPSLPMPLVLVAATVITALLVSVPAGSAAPAPVLDSDYDSEEDAPAATAAGPREEGQVKWFNVSKGFGFITKDNGEEIFVHFRSIRGEGRRGLREGQRVSFVESHTDKGPQAEDVEGL